ncbi:hypothetical protein [Polaribacter sp. MED152]|uniref:hypothetical protein n=1 Tax=Polaribacter sp. MED152 TaxID=313598 RepID=UPI000068C971|nr:hypothetical protein [Polaribacter sp. MED152]
MRKTIYIAIIFGILISCKQKTESKKSRNITSKFQKNKIDKTLIYGIWNSTKGGDADFRITENEFYLVDFFESSEFILDGILIKVKGSEYYENGVILKVSKDSLKIKWVELNVTVDYWKFKD